VVEKRNGIAPLRKREEKVRQFGLGREVNGSPQRKEKRRVITFSASGTTQEKQ